MKRILVAALLFSWLLSPDVFAQKVKVPKQKIKLQDTEIFNTTDVFNKGNISLSFTANFKYPIEKTHSGSPECNGNVTDKGYFFYAVVKDKQGHILNDTNAATTFFFIIPEEGKLSFATSVHLWFEDISAKSGDKIKIQIKALDNCQGQVFKPLFSKWVEIFPNQDYTAYKQLVKASDLRFYKDTVFSDMRGMMIAFDVSRNPVSDTSIRKQEFVFQAVLRDSTGYVVFNSEYQGLQNHFSEQTLLTNEANKTITIMIPYAEIAVNEGLRNLSAEVQFNIKGYLLKTTIHKTALLKYNQPEVIQLALSFTDLNVSGANWDNAVFGPGYPDPYWLLTINGNMIYASKSLTNKFVIPSGALTFYAVEGDTLNFLVYDDDDNFFKRMVKPNDDLIGSRYFIISLAKTWGKMTGVSFGSVESVTFDLQQKKASFKHEGPIKE
jgi:hypothetical protein